MIPPAPFVVAMLPISLLTSFAQQKGQTYPISWTLNIQPGAKRQERGLWVEGNRDWVISKMNVLLLLLGTQHKISEKEHRHHLMRHS